MRTRHRVAVVAGAAAAASATLAIALASAGGGGGGEHASHRSVGPTAVVTRRDLADTEELDATLGFADVRPLAAPVAGTVSGIARSGETLHPGQTLYRLDGKPAVLLDGRVPAWRALEEGIADGTDVGELERNLVRLGLDPERAIVVDDHFTAATRAAVEALQRRYGLPPSGSLALGQVVFLPGSRRITGISAHVGDQVAVGAPLLTTSATTRVAKVTLDTGRRSLLTAGKRVTVVLPDSRSVAGRVASVGATANVSQQQDTPQSQAPQSATVDATVALRSPVDEPDGTPVTVRVAVDVRRRVLAVPVTALLSTSGGDRSLEVVEAGGATRVVAVRTGLYAGGYVEVAAAGIHDGTKVVDAPR